MCFTLTRKINQTFIRIHFFLSFPLSPSLLHRLTHTHRITLETTVVNETEQTTGCSFPAWGNKTREICLFNVIHY